MSLRVNKVVKCTQLSCPENNAGNCYGPIAGTCTIYDLKISGQMRELDKAMEENSVNERDWEAEAKSMTDMNQNLMEEVKDMKNEIESMSMYIKDLEFALAVAKAELKGFRTACTGKVVKE